MLIALAFGVLLQACAGYRGGWESVPYVGDVPPALLPEASTPHESYKRSELQFPGLTLGLGINNQVRTYDTQVYLFVVPLGVDPRNVPTQRVDAGMTRINLRIKVQDARWVLRPGLARFRVAGKTVAAKAAFEWGRWDAQGHRVKTGGEWRYRATGDEASLDEPDRTYLLVLDFPVDAPSPESRELSLDLSEALVGAGRPPLPLIRFIPARWKEGYT